MSITLDHAQNALLRIRHGNMDDEVIRSLAESSIDTLPHLAREFDVDMPIEQLERLEVLLKLILKTELSRGSDGVRMREIIELLRPLGLLRKYKSYAVKLSNPLGYSIFLQRPGEGFSFQRHITHKLELFHILSALPGGFVFLCSHEEWEAVFEPDAFAAWLGGQPDERYERFRIPATGGDVFIIDTIGTVHTVIGCILEEYANVSVDMVTRLFDQNIGKNIPKEFIQENVLRNLRDISLPPASRAIIGHGPGRRIVPIVDQPIPGGFRRTLADSPVAANHLIVTQGSDTALLNYPREVAAIACLAGQGRMILADAAESRRPSPPSIPIRQGDVLYVPQNAHYAFVSEAGVLHLAEHRIPLDVAL